MSLDFAVVDSENADSWGDGADTQQASPDSHKMVSTLQLIC